MLARTGAIQTLARPNRAVPAATARLSAVWLVPAGFFIVAAGLALLRHEAFATGRHDLEIYTQVCWDLANGAPFATTLLRTNSLHLAEHLALVLLPLAPLYGLLPDPRLLLVVQAGALATMVLTIVWWAVRRLGPRLGLLIGLAATLTPMLAGIALDDFHAVVLAALPMTLGFVLALAGRPRSAALLLLAAALMEEEAALALVGLGLLLLARRPRRLGAGLVVGGVGLLLLVTGVIMPGFHHPKTLGAGVGTRSMEHFSAVRSQPGLALQRLVEARGREAALQFVLPTGGLALLSPSLLLGGTPTFAALLLQDRDDTFTRHWAAPIYAAIWLATIGTLARQRGARRTLSVGALLVGSAAAYLLASPLPGGAAFQPTDYAHGDREDGLQRGVTLVPPDAPTAASANVVAHLANRRELYFFPVDEQYAEPLGYEDRPLEAFVLDLNEPDTQRMRPLGKRSPLMYQPPLAIQSTDHKILVLTRSVPPPQHELNVRFGNSLLLVGYDLERPAQRLRLVLHWELRRPVYSDLRRIVRLLDASGRELVVDDELELTRTLETQKWEQGQWVRDELELTVPAEANPPLRARIEWRNRDRDNPQRLPDGAEGFELPLQR